MTSVLGAYTAALQTPGEAEDRHDANRASRHYVTTAGQGGDKLAGGGETTTLRARLRFVSSLALRSE